MGSFSIIIDDAKFSLADLNNRVNPEPTDRRREINQLIDYLGGVGGGVHDAEVNVSTSSGDLVAASGTAVCASVNAADTVTINGVVFTAVTGAAANAQFDRSGTDSETATNLVTAVNSITGSNAAMVSGFVTGSASGATATFTATHKGLLGNAITLASSNGTRLAVSAARLTGGAGGFGASSSEYNYGV